MSERRTISVSLYSDANSITYAKLQALVANLTPDELATVEIRARSYDAYGDSSADLEIEYTRKQTEEEAAAEEDTRRLWDEEQRRQELATYLRLKGRLGL